MLKKGISFTMPENTFIKHPKKLFFCPVVNRSFSAHSMRKTGCSLRGLSLYLVVRELLLCL